MPISGERSSRNKNLVVLAHDHRLRLGAKRLKDQETGINSVAISTIYEHLAATLSITRQTAVIQFSGIRATVASTTVAIVVLGALLAICLVGSVSAQTVISKPLKFPVKITKSGSYILKSNLAPPLNVDAIDISANNVTIDLNGFSIGANPTLGSVWAISASSSSGVVVRNGQVSGICLHLGQSALVEDVIALNCTVTDSIAVGANSSVIRSIATGGHATGIDCLDSGPTLGSNCLFADDTANGNGTHGIGCQRNGCNFARNTTNGNGTIIAEGSGLDCNGVGCLFDGNVSNSNASAGIASSDGTSAMTGNVLNGNSSTPFGGATSLGHNLCNGSAC
jgi:hypothetical protein